MGKERATRRILAIVLTLALCVPALIVPEKASAAITAASVQAKMEAYTSWMTSTGYSLNGAPKRFWNKGYSTATLKSALNSGNFDTGCTSSACSKHEWSGDICYGCTSNFFSNGYQCNGFARYFWYYLYGTYLEWGSDQTYSVKYTSYSAAGGLQRGDMVGNGEHFAIVDYVESNGRVVFFHCNGLETNYPCGIIHGYWVTNSGANLTTTMINNNSAFFIRRHKDLIGATSGGSTGSGGTTVTDCDIYGCSASNGSGTYICTASDGLYINSGHNYSSPIAVIPYGAVVTVAKVAANATYAHVTYGSYSGIASINYLKPYTTSSECNTYGCTTAVAGYYKVSSKVATEDPADPYLLLNPSHQYSNSGYVAKMPAGAIVYVTKGVPDSSSNTFYHVNYGSYQGIASRNYLDKLASYTLTLNANGGSVSRTSFTVWKEVGDFNNLDGYLPTRSGYTFLGWYTSASGGTRVYDEDGKCTNDGTYWKNNVWNYSGNVTLYAHWQANTIYVESISMPDTVFITVGDTAEISATVLPSNATNPTLGWSSSDPSVVTVSNGVITAVSLGSAYVSASSSDATAVSATCNVVVTPRLVDAISLNKTSLTLVAGGEAGVLTPSFAPADATEQSVVWASSDPSVAIVSSGVVSPLRAGSAIITATAVDGGDASAACVVTVLSAVESMEMNRYLVRLATEGVGSSYRLQAQTEPADVAYEISFSSANESIATVTDSGLITAVAPGTTQITATIYNGPEVSVSVVVQEMALAEVPSGTEAIEDEAFRNASLERVSLSGGVESIGANAFADNALLRYARIPSSVTSIAPDAFAGDGNLVILCASGSYAETWAIENEVEYMLDEDAASVFVKSISLPRDMTIEVDSELSLPATVSPASATNKALAWSSSDEAVAVVTGQGVVTTVGEGTAVITAAAQDGSGVSASFTIIVTIPAVDCTFSVNSDGFSTDVEDASLAANLSVSGVDPEKVQQTGVILLDAQGVQIASAVNAPALSDGVISCAWNVNADLGVALSPATAYQYQFYAVIYGRTFYSGLYSFTTQEATPRIRIPASLELPSGSTYTLSPVVQYATDDTLVWMSNRSTVVSVSNGQLTAVAPGAAIVTAMLAEDPSVRAVCAVTVVDGGGVPVSELVLSDESITLEIGETYLIECSVLPETAGNASVTVVSTDPSVASVDEQGFVTAVASGEADIIFTAGDGSPATAICTVTVPGSIQVAFTDYPAKESIGSTQAVLAKTIHVSGDAAIDDVTYVGLHLYSASGALLCSKREAPKTLNGVINAWYDVNNELGYTLLPDMSYQYRFVAVIDGVDYYSDMYLFTTEPRAAHAITVSQGAEPSVRSDGAVVACAIATDGVAVEMAQCDLYDANGTYLMGASAYTQGSGGSYAAQFDTADDLTLILEPGTTYQYRFSVSVDGTEYTSGAFSFTTLQVDDGVSVEFTDYWRQSIGSSNATLARTMSVTGASISDVQYVGCHVYNMNNVELGSMREAPTPLNGVINAWYSVKTDLGVVLQQGVTYKYRFVAVINGQDHFSEPGYFTLTQSTPNTTKIQQVINRAYQWVNYTWTAPVDIPVYNNLYNLSAYTNYYQAQLYFPAGTVMHGLPYTLSSGCKYNLERYAALSSANKGAAATFSYKDSNGNSVLMWGTKYGADCVELVADCLYAGDSSIGTDGQTHFTTTKAHLYEAISWDEVAPGDALGISGHAMIVVGVSGDNITVVEQCGNGNNSGALFCPNRTSRPEGGYYVCGTCAYCAGAKKAATVLHTYTKDELNSYTVYRYLPLYE